MPSALKNFKTHTAYKRLQEGITRFRLKAGTTMEGSKMGILSEKEKRKALLSGLSALDAKKHWL